jgi:hypothetical protein
MEEGHPVERIIVASSQVLNADRRKKIETLAAKHGASVAGIYDQTGLAPLFYQNPEWRRRLLGLGGELDGLVRRPIELDLTPGGSAPLVGRGESLERLAGETVDLILIAVPGAGKTRLLGELDGVWFVEDASDEAVADTARRERPRRIVVDDAALDTRRIELLLRLRAAEPELGFSIVAVGWPGDEPELMQAMPTATVQHLDLLEPEHINSIVESLGITAWGLRSEILDQAAGRPGVGRCALDARAVRRT